MESSIPSAMDTILQKRMIKLSEAQKLDMFWCSTWTENNMFSYGGMEPSP